MTRPQILLIAAFLTALGAPASAQLISIKTLPIAQADQFDIFPSRSAGIGGLSIALADTVFDASINPAKGVRLQGGSFFGSPTIYSVSQAAGAGRTLPVGAYSRMGRWFGGIAAALQEVDAGQQGFAPRPLDLVGGAPVVTTSSFSNRSHGNTLGFITLGHAFPGGVSVGASAFGAALSAMDGVDFLYAGSSSVIQSGYAADVRLGFLKEWEGSAALEAVVLHNRYAMTHDVTFLRTFWDPPTQSTRQSAEMEHNLDHTNTWGLHTGYQRAVADGWRIGTIATVNRMFHPKLPNFDVRTAGIVAIPWDPGDSWAFNAGVGVSKTRGAATFGFDAIYEPIWTYTWGEAEVGPVPIRTGGTIPLGGKTVENHFVFSNWQFRLGAAHELALGKGGTALIPQVGVQVRSIRYWLDQMDHVQVAARQQQERWREWTPTWGLVFRFPELEIRYQGRATSGTGRPGVISNGRCETCDFATVATGNILVAPVGPVTLGDVLVTTHKISISVPLGTPRGGGR